MPQRYLRCGQGNCLMPARTTRLVFSFTSPAYTCPPLWMAIFGIFVYGARQTRDRLLLLPVNVILTWLKSLVYCIQSCNLPRRPRARAHEPGPVSNRPRKRDQGQGGDQGAFQCRLGERQALARAPLALGREPLPL